MSNYTPVTNFGAKDALISGNPLKLIKGADFTTEFTAVQTAINSKFDGSVQFAPDGTAGQPSFGFSNNVGTGMYNVGGVLNFATGTAQRGLISTAGNFTFNAPTSGTTLTVNGFSGTTAVSVTPGNVTDYGFNVAASATGNSAYQMQQNGVTGGSVGLAGAAGQLITGSQQSDLCIRAVAGAIRFAASGNSSTQASLDASGNFNVSNGVSATIGPIYYGVPVSSTVTTVALSDVGKCIAITANIGIPSGTFSGGNALSIYNDSAGSLTINGSIATIRLAGTATTGNRTLAARGMATLWFRSATEVIVGGPGVS